MMFRFNRHHHRCPLTGGSTLSCTNLRQRGSPVYLFLVMTGIFAALINACQHQAISPNHLYHLTPAIRGPF
jgi:hypothetical protein